MNRNTAEEKFKAIYDAIDQLLIFYLSHGCPCTFPRFRFLSGFHHAKYNVGPIKCIETDYFINASTKGPHHFLKQIKLALQESNKRVTLYECKICGTKYKEIWNSNDNFDCATFEIEHKPDLLFNGAMVELPVPLSGGLLGFRNEDIIKCSSDFSPATLDEFIRYMKQLSIK